MGATVIPAKTEIQNCRVLCSVTIAGNPGIPAFAGMTVADRQIPANVVFNAALV